MRRALRKRRVFDFVPSYLKKCFKLNGGFHRVKQGLQGSSHKFLKEYTEGKCGGPGAVPPVKFLIFEVTQPYFFVFLNAKKVWKVQNNPQ